MGAVTEYAASVAEAGAAALAKAFESMPATLQTFSPLDKGRAALDQIQECAMINGIASQILMARAMPEIDLAAARAERLSYDTAETALAYLHANSEKLGEAIRTFPEEKMADTVVLPFGPNGLTKSFAQIFEMPNWNMAYHEGQINYIKNLYAEG